MRTITIFARQKPYILTNMGMFFRQQPAIVILEEIASIKATHTTSSNDAFEKLGDLEKKGWDDAWQVWSFTCVVSNAMHL